METQDNIKRLLQKLDPDPSCAWEKYENVRRRLLKFFEWNQCWFAEELADETLERVAKKAETVEIRDFGNFALGVARYVRLEGLKKFRRGSSIEDYPGGPDCIADPLDSERKIVEDVDHQIRLTCLYGCLSRLNSHERELAISYYSAEEDKQKIHRLKIANQAGISMVALRVRANRVRNKLEKCVAECLTGRRRTLNAVGKRALG